MTEHSTDLTPGDITAIIQLTNAGVSVTRNIWCGDEYISISWRFERDDDGDEDDEPEIDDNYLADLMNRRKN